MYVLVEHCGLGYLICMVMISISALFSLNIIYQQARRLQVALCFI